MFTYIKPPFGVFQVEMPLRHDDVDFEATR